MNNKKELNQENEEPRIPTYQKFFALSGVIGQYVMATRPEIMHSTPIEISSLGLAFLALIAGKYISPNKSFSKAAILTLGGTALTIAGMNAGFHEDPIKNALLAIPVVIALTGVTIFGRRVEDDMEKYKP